MKKMYQRKWLGIDFAAFTKPSSWSLADETFYGRFYQAVFQRYRSWEELPLSWRGNKQAVARLIFDQAQPGDAVLSIGCGLGMVEHFLLEMSGGAMELEVTDTSSAALIWLKNEMPPHRVHLGLVPGCLPPGKKYQLIYLSAVDYALAQPVWLKLLEEIRSLLAPGGKCLIISPSLEPDKSFWRRALEQGKEAAKILLEIAGLHRRGQFWGWARTREEYRRSFRQAGFARIADGFSAPEQSAGTYWISGEKAA